MEVGGLPRTDYPGFADEFAQLVAAVNGWRRPVAATGRRARRSRVMAALSDNLVTFAILAYLVAMICHAVEYALGNARARVAAGALRPASWSVPGSAVAVVPDAARRRSRRRPARGRPLRPRRARLGRA